MRLNARIIMKFIEKMSISIKQKVIESCTEKGLLFLFHFTLPYKSLVPNKNAFFTFERSATFIMTFKHVFPSLPVSWGIKTCSLGTHKVNYPFTL